MTRDNRNGYTYNRYSKQTRRTGTCTQPCQASKFSSQLWLSWIPLFDAVCETAVAWKIRYQIYRRPRTIARIRNRSTNSSVSAFPHHRALRFRTVETLCDRVRLGGEFRGRLNRLNSARSLCIQRAVPPSECYKRPDERVDMLTDDFLRSISTPGARNAGSEVDERTSADTRNSSGKQHFCCKQRRIELVDTIRQRTRLR